MIENVIDSISGKSCNNRNLFHKSRLILTIAGLLCLMSHFCCPAVLAANPWDTSRGQACFERWISDSMSRLNNFRGDKNFNDRKPWTINKYGLLEGNPRTGPRSAYAPDNFSQFNNNKYWWMWENYRYSYSFSPGWKDANWNNAGVPRLREYVNDCVNRSSAGDDISGPVSPLTPPRPPAGNACGFTLGSGIYNKWISTGGERGFLGCPATNELDAGRSPQGTTGRFAEFRGGDGGYIIWHGSGKFQGMSFEVHGCIYKLYRNQGTMGWLGFPVSDEYAVAGGGRRSDFEGGYVQWDSASRQCKAYPYGTSADNKQQFCDQYAKTAVTQNEENQRKQCGYNGARWQSNYANHYGWCLNTDRGMADYETNVRQDELGRCRGGVSQPQTKSKYIGCFRDSGDRDFTFDGGMNLSNTRESCIEICTQKGFGYAGMQASSYCFCGNRYGKYGPATNCDRPCPGNPSQTCGGALANDVFSTGIPVAPKR